MKQVTILLGVVRAVGTSNPIPQSSRALIFFFFFFFFDPSTYIIAKSIAITALSLYLR